MRQRASLRTPAHQAVVLAVAVAVVLGVLAMHAVGGGAHNPTSAGHGTVADAGEPPVQAHALHDVLAPAGEPFATAMEGVTASLSAAARGESSDGAVATIAVCVAMLLSVVVLLRRAHDRSAPTRRSEPVQRALLARSGHPPTARPPDLVTELCVMRT